MKKIYDYITRKGTAASIDLSNVNQMEEVVKDKSTRLYYYGRTDTKIVEIPYKELRKKWEEE